MQNNLSLGFLQTAASDSAIIDVAKFNREVF